MALRALARGQRTDAIDCGVQDLRSAAIASGKPAVASRNTCGESGRSEDSEVTMLPAEMAASKNSGRAETERGS